MLGLNYFMAVTRLGRRCDGAAPRCQVSALTPKARSGSNAWPPIIG